MIFWIAFPSLVHNLPRREVNVPKIYQEERRGECIYSGHVMNHWLRQLFLSVHLTSPNSLAQARNGSKDM